MATRAGRVEGGEQRGVEVFRGIPFARPPIGALRFRAPEPVEPWSGIRMARDNAPSAPQVGPVNRLIRALIGAAGSKQSQDCLYLNVWTPRCDRRRRPVMVWLHGGAFILGSGTTPLYAGWRLAERGDVVVVTLNYRLGALGFLSFAKLSSGSARPPANVGIRDQIAALEWVRDNIEQFGGDPGNVTVFGESAGAMSTGTLLGTPSARGLFHRAILESGAAHNVSSAGLADRVAAHFVEGLGLLGDYEHTLTELSVTELMRAQARTSARFGLDDGVMAWQPSVDGDLIPEQPLGAIERGLSADVPVLVGTNRDEWKLFIAADPRGLRLDEAGFRARLERILPGRNAEGKEYSAVAAGAYARVKGPRGGEPSERWAAFQNDRIFHYPATCLLDRQSDHQEHCYAYLFEWTPPLLGRWVGACHGLELPFVFGGLRAAFMRAGLGAPRSAQRLCNRMQDSWIAFARSGDPQHADMPEWPPYSRSARNTMSLGVECTLRDDPHERGREFWEPLISEGEARWR